MSVFNLLDSIKIGLSKIPKVDLESEFNIYFKKLKKNNLQKENKSSNMANLASSFETLNLNPKTKSEFNNESKSEFKPELFVTPSNVNKIYIPDLPQTVLQISPDLDSIPEIKPAISTISQNPVIAPVVVQPVIDNPLVSASSITSITTVAPISNKPHIYTLEELTKKGVTKPVLQDILVRLGGKKTGNKDELINRILEIQKNTI